MKRGRVSGDVRRRRVGRIMEQDSVLSRQGGAESSRATEGAEDQKEP